MTLSHDLNPTPGGLIFDRGAVQPPPAGLTHGGLARLRGVVGPMILPLLLSGCYSRQHARIYGVRDGKAGTITVDAPANGGGRVSSVLAGGERCEGTFGEAIDTIGARVATDISTGARSGAVLVCPDKVLRCTLARRTGGFFTYGACRDDHGREYRVFF